MIFYIENGIFVYTTWGKLVKVHVKVTHKLSVTLNFSTTLSITILTTLSGHKIIH